MATVKKGFSGWVRWLHIYLSMFSFAALLFFAITGITLNHTEWIEGRQTIRQEEGKLPNAWVSPDSAHVNDLKIVEFFRSQYAIRASVKDFITDPTECAVSFKGPGYNADGFIDRTSGEFTLTITQSGWVAVLNDLHKGRDTGKTWAGLIDVSAILMVLVSATGLMMIFFLKRWRFSGLILSFIGLVVLIAIYKVFV
jgi:hypothetical protein